MLTRIPPQFQGRLEFTYGHYDQEQLKRENPVFKEQYLDRVEEVLRPWEPVLEELPDEVVITYVPGNGMEELRWRVGDRLTGTEGGTLRTWKNGSSTSSNTLNLQEDPARLDQELDLFKEWIPVAMLDSINKIRLFYVKQAQERQEKMEAIIFRLLDTMKIKQASRE